MKVLENFDFKIIKNWDHESIESTYQSITISVDHSDIFPFYFVNINEIHKLDFIFNSINLIFNIWI